MVVVKDALYKYISIYLNNTCLVRSTTTSTPNCVFSLSFVCRTKKKNLKSKKFWIFELNHSFFFPSFFNKQTNEDSLFCKIKYYYLLLFLWYISSLYKKKLMLTQNYHQKSHAIRNNTIQYNTERRGGNQLTAQLLSLYKWNEIKRHTFYWIKRFSCFS